ncbi:MAG: class I adenylate-forming enzyme family protein, partial [Betaproteobacteria bacterium]
MSEFKKNELWVSLVKVKDSSPQKIAVYFHSHKITYGDLYDRAYRLSFSLLRMGIKKGDCIALLSANRPEYLELLFACSRIGAVLAPLNSRYGSSDLHAALVACDASVLFLTPRFRNQDFISIFKDACLNSKSEPISSVTYKSMPSLNTVVLLEDDKRLDNAISYQTLFDEKDPIHAVEGFPNMPVLVLFTSGSSGAPKPILLTQTQLVNCAENLIQRQGITTDDCILSFLPYFHVYGGVLTTLVPLLAGSSLVIQEAFDSTLSLNAVQIYRCTVIYSIAPCWQAWLDHSDLKKFDLSSIRTGICASGSIGSSAVPKRVRAMFGEMFTQYGMTETTGVATMSCPNDSEYLVTETAGRPLPGVEISIFDNETKSWLGCDSEGEICVRSNMMSPGYVGHVGLRSLDSNGWLHTGDRGFMGKDGYLRVIGRLDDRLRSGGENIDPIEVEQFLGTHIDVLRAFVVGVPDSRLGEIPVVFIILKKEGALNE